MKFTNKSNHLISFFVENTKNNCINLPKNTTKTNKTSKILTHLYNDIKNGVSYVKKQLGETFYNVNTEYITNIKQIPNPTTFPPNAFPNNVRKHIDENIIGLIEYNFNIFDRQIHILFLTEDENIDINIYNNYVTNMLVWLYIVDLYSSKKCANKLSIFIYHTSLLKILPETNIEILNENNVNTAFTRTCPVNSEIVVFRKEEWFKAFIHETFHNFNLDFSNMNMSLFNQQILNIFPVVSNINLFESYSEFWARIINALFCSFIKLKDKNNVNEFIQNAELFIHTEIIFSFFQMVKVLKFMGLTYTDLYSKTDVSNNIRNTLYKENTSVLSYYIITTILMNNYADFFMWCDTNNSTLLNFKKTAQNINDFCKFIKKKYKTTQLLKNITCAEMLLHHTTLTYKQKQKQNNAKNILYVLNNLRMTICEMK